MLSHTADLRSSNRGTILTCDCRWQSPRSRKRSWDGLPKRPDLLMHFYPRTYIRYSGCQYSCHESWSRRAGYAGLTPLATPDLSSCTTISYGWHVKDCRSQRSTSYPTVEMANKDLSVESWQKSYAPHSTTYSACSITTHRSASSQHVPTSLAVRRRVF
jgi:hypothetical protein